MKIFVKLFLLLSTIACVFACIGCSSGSPQSEARVAPVETPPASPAVAATAEPAPAPTARRVANPDDYNDGGIYCYDSPPQGGIIVYQTLQEALANPRNNDAVFPVTVFASVPEDYSMGFWDHSYNGHTVAEWQELVSLSNGEYPYREYNGDHGGNITEAQWEQAQEEAKMLDAQANLDAAQKEYAEKVEPVLEESKNNRLQSERERLAGMGYDLQVSEGLLTGLLTKEQIDTFPADPECGYFIEWRY